MVFKWKIENRATLLFLSFLLILIIGVWDYLTSAELTLSIFYLIPISLHASHKRAKTTDIIINSFVAAIAWALVMFEARYYSNNFYATWNASAMFVIFLLTGLLILSLNKKIRKINEMNKYLLQLNEEKNKFLGIAAHDLKNPISAIYMCSEIILDKYATQINPDLSRLINLIQDSTKNTLVLLTNLLDVSVIESGKIKIIFEVQDYIDFIKRNLYSNQIIASNKDIIIRLETDENEIGLKFDAHYLMEVFNNLLSNAIKYSYPRSEIVVKVTKTNRNSILTEIIDQGKGIPENEQIKLFNYFQKTSTQPTAGEKSTGLGLAIARKIIIEHGGKIGVKSIINSGSNFYYELFLE